MFFCFMFLRVELKKIKFQEDMYEVGLCRHEITMTMIVRMRLVTLEFVASQLG